MGAGAAADVPSAGLPAGGRHLLHGAALGDGEELREDLLVQRGHREAWNLGPMASKPFRASVNGHVHGNPNGNEWFSLALERIAASVRFLKMQFDLAVVIYSVKLLVDSVQKLFCPIRCHFGAVEPVSINMKLHINLLTSPLPLYMCGYYIY